MPLRTRHALGARELVDPRMSERTLRMMDRAVEHLEAGDVEEEFDLSGLEDLDGDGE